MGANFNRIKTWITEILQPTDLNAEFDNILNNFTPTGMDDASINLAAMQITTDPYPASVASLPTSLEEELRRLRYLITQLSGKTYWYQDPDTSLAALVGGAYALVTKTITYTPTSSDGVILVSASGGAITITLPAASSVSAGKIYLIKKIDSSANAVTVDGNGSETIDGLVTKYLTNQYEWLEVINDGTNWMIINRSQLRKIPQYKNLVIANKTGAIASQVTISATALDVIDAYNNIHRLESVSISAIDITASGINGLDTGAEAAAQTYAIWVIWNSTTNTTAGLFSTSFTAPTMPSGYDFKRLVGFVRNVSSNFLEFHQQDTKLWYDDPVDDTLALSSGSASSFTDVDLSVWAGSSVLVTQAIIGWHHSSTTDAITNLAYVRPNGMSGNGKILGTIRRSTGTSNYGQYNGGETTIWLDSNLMFEYKLTDTTSDLDIYVHGVILNL